MKTSRRKTRRNSAGVIRIYQQYGHTPRLAHETQRLTTLSGLVAAVQNARSGGRQAWAEGSATALKSLKKGTSLEGVERRGSEVTVYTSNGSATYYIV